MNATMDLGPLNSGVLFILGAIIFPATFLIQRSWWTKSERGRELKERLSLTEKDIVYISNKVVSAFQAVCAGISGLLVCRSCFHDVVHASHPMTLIYAWFGIPYFLYDTLSMFYIYTFKVDPSNPKGGSMLNKFMYFVLDSPVIFIHHMVMAPIGWTLIMMFRNPDEPGDFFVGIIYMMEVSTPFVSFRFILSKLKMKSSKIYLVNGILMLFTFPIFRILSVLYAGALYSEQRHFPSFWKCLQSLQLHWKIVWGAALAPQIYWFLLMAKGLLKILLVQMSSPKVDGIQKSSNCILNNLTPSNSHVYVKSSVPSEPSRLVGSVPYKID